MAEKQLTPRDLSRIQTLDRIERAAFAHLDSGGVEAVNLRAVARELGLSPSALYRYVADRDDLLTMLIRGSFNGLADFVEAELSSINEGLPPRVRIEEIARAMRHWAQKFPQRWALIYGSPVVNYHAPPSATTTAGTRVVHLIAGSLVGADASGDLSGRSAELTTDLGTLSEEEPLNLAPNVLELGMELWTRIIGLVSSEVFSYFGPDALSDPGEFFDRSIRRAIDQFSFADRQRTKRP